MGCYAEKSDLQNYLGKSYESLYKNDSVTPESDLLEASAEIDGYLAKRYQTPVQSAECAILLRKWCVALAGCSAYRLAAGSETPKKFKDAADETRKILRDVSGGVFALPASPLETPHSVGGAVAVECDEPVFTRETMKGY